LSASRPRGDAYAALAVLALVWGYTWVVIKVATHDASPLVVTAVRPALGAVCLFAALTVMRRSLRPTPLRDTIVLGLLQTTGFTLLQTLAVSLAGAGKVAVLAYTMPFWVALLAWPFLGERIDRGRWIALALAALGLGFVLAPLNAHAVLADLLGVASGIVWAASAVWAKRLRARHDVELLSLTAWQMLWGAIPLVVMMLAVPEQVRWTTSFVLSMAYMTVASQALAWVLWLFILSRLPAGVAGIASLATPVLGVAFAALQLHEIPTGTELVGIGLIVAALVVNSRPPAQRSVRGGPGTADPLATVLD
jgi:drug/metabolite transporter (DMT)-like permease